MNTDNKAKSGAAKTTRPRTKMAEATIPVPPIAKPEVTRLTSEEVSQIMSSIDAERIRRTMMLFDLRWVDENHSSFIPNEDQIMHMAYIVLNTAVTNGRRIGAADVHHRGFRGEYFVSVNYREIVRLSYVLCEGSNVLALQ